LLAWLFSDPLPAGVFVPDLSLLDQDGKIVSLSALRGRNGELYHTRGFMVKHTVYLIGPDGRIGYAKRGMSDPDEVLADAL